MSLITLTTDLGNKDFYQPALKGSILSLWPHAQLVDISHDIPAFDIAQAAFVLKNAYPFFPIGTVHLIGVDPTPTPQVRHIALAYRGHYFVGADNGIFSLLFDGGSPSEVVELHIKQDLRFVHFPLLDLYAKAAAHIARGGKLLDIGASIPTVEEKMQLQPVIEHHVIRGSVIYIDYFQNVITNIKKSLFINVQQNRSFTLFFQKNESISRLSWHYNEVPEGEKLCLFGLSNYLEIAINKGHASGLLGLCPGDIVRIEFHA